MHGERPKHFKLLEALSRNFAPSHSIVLYKNKTKIKI